MRLNEIIDERMKYRGVNQTELCKECELSVQNYNSFLKGNRALPKNSLIKVMQFLTLSYKGESEGLISPSDIEERLLSLINSCGEKATQIASKTNISASTLSSISNGKRQMSTKVLEALTEYFRFQVVSL